jgi:hypothetical protein
MGHGATPTMISFGGSHAAGGRRVLTYRRRIATSNAKPRVLATLNATAEGGSGDRPELPGGGQAPAADASAGPADGRAGRRVRRVDPGTDSGDLMILLFQIRMVLGDDPAQAGQRIISRPTPPT